MTDTQDKAKRGGLWVYLLFGVVGLLLVAYCAYWWWLRGELDKGVDAWIAEQRAAGLQIEFDKKRLHGFPYRFALTVDGPRVRSPDGLSWRGEKLQIVMQPWNFNHAIGRAPGRNEFNGPNAEAATLLVRDRSALSVRWNDEAIQRISLVFDDADLVLPEGDIGFDDFAVNVATPKDDPANIRFSMDWKTLALPEAPGDAPWLGRVLDRGAVKLEFEGLMDTLSVGGSALEWAAGEGALDIPQILINWGPVKLGLKGDVKMDANGYPEGTISLRLEDTPPLEAALLEAGLLDDETTGYLRAIGQASENGQFIPVSFRQGGVYFLGQRVADLPSATELGGL